jgi:hypothetical protein
MIRVILLPPLFLFAVCLSAQNLKFVHGKPTEKKVSYLDKKYGRQEFKLAYFDTLTRTSFHQVLTVDGANMEILKDYVDETPTIKNFEFKIAGSETGIPMCKFANMNNKFYALYTTKKGKENSAWIQEVGADLKSKGQPQLLATFQTPIGIHLSKERDQIILISDEVNKLLVRSFNSNTLKAQWSNDFEIKTEGLILKSVGATVDGYLYLGGYHESKKKDIINHFVIAYSSKTQQHQTSYFPKEEGIDLFNFDMTLLKMNEPIVACMYSKKKEMGYRIYKISPETLKLEQFATEPVSDEFKKATVLGYKNNNFGMVGLEKLKNGNIVFSIEGQVVQNPMKFGDPTRTSEIFYCSPANVICINPSGKEHWDKVVKKFQRQGTASHLIGHYFFQHDNKVYLVYNDTNENFNLNPLADQKAWMLKEKNVYVTIVEIDEKGTARRLNLLSKTPTEVSYFVVDQTEKISDNLFQLKMTTAKGTHFSLLEVK